MSTSIWVDTKNVNILIVVSTRIQIVIKSIVISTMCNLHLTTVAQAVSWQSLVVQFYSLDKNRVPALYPRFPKYTHTFHFYLNAHVAFNNPVDGFDALEALYLWL